MASVPRMLPSGPNVTLCRYPGKITTLGPAPYEKYGDLFQGPEASARPWGNGGFAPEQPTFFTPHPPRQGLVRGSYRVPGRRSFSDAVSPLSAINPEEKLMLPEGVGNGAPTPVRDEYIYDRHYVGKFVKKHVDTLRVGGLAEGVTIADVERLFGTYGPLVHIPTPLQDSGHFQYTFIQFKEMVSARNALEQLRNYPFKGMRLQVEICRKFFPDDLERRRQRGSTWTAHDHGSTSKEQNMYLNKKYSSQDVRSQLPDPVTWPKPSEAAGSATSQPPGGKTSTPYKEPPASNVTTGEKKIAEAIQHVKQVEANDSKPAPKASKKKNSKRQKSSNREISTPDGAQKASASKKEGDSKRGGPHRQSTSVDHGPSKSESAADAQKKTGTQKKNQNFKKTEALKEGETSTSKQKTNGSKDSGNKVHVPTPAQNQGGQKWSEVLKPKVSSFTGGIGGAMAPGISVCASSYLSSEPWDEFKGRAPQISKKPEILKENSKGGHDSKETTINQDESLPDDLVHAEVKPAGFEKSPTQTLKTTTENEKDTQVPNEPSGNVIVPAPTTSVDQKPAPQKSGEPKKLDVQEPVVTPKLEGQQGPQEPVVTPKLEGLEGPQKSEVTEKKSPVAQPSSLAPTISELLATIARVETTKLETSVASQNPLITEPETAEGQMTGSKSNDVPQEKQDASEAGTKKPAAVTESLNPFAHQKAAQKAAQKALTAQKKKERRNKKHNPKLSQAEKSSKNSSESEMSLPAVVPRGNDISPAQDSSTVRSKLPGAPIKPVGMDSATTAKANAEQPTGAAKVMEPSSSHDMPRNHALNTANNLIPDLTSMQEKAAVPGTSGNKIAFTEAAKQVDATTASDDAAKQPGQPVGGLPGSVTADSGGGTAKSTSNAKKNRKKYEKKKAKKAAMETEVKGGADNLSSPSFTDGSRSPSMSLRGSPEIDIPIKAPESQKTSKTAEWTWLEDEGY
ncbi:hypothetical protein EJ06DRAFT_200679 [Trichodelitschia bisporula]|uniref:RRM domain-containing protein n=1 Tax=Trichodelitschia bisporula TaxID=703511 RepID=A0A6G1I8G0_9PEZI|nr:hypothetical protein EJ06DRAFT_200679 [Trichodelitschia bisporula]